MYEIYKAEHVSLHVRKSNKAAISLYKDSLGFHVAKVESKYCMSHFLSQGSATKPTTDGDGEDALSMQLNLTSENTA